MRKFYAVFAIFVIVFTVVPNKAKAGPVFCNDIITAIPCMILSIPTAIVGNAFDSTFSKSSTYKEDEEQRTVTTNNNLTNRATEPLYKLRKDDEPYGLESLVNIRKENTVIDGDSKLPLDIRGDAIKEAALSYGARGGLAWRTFHIRAELETRARYLDKIYDFSQLLIPAPSGLLIEPPVISEAMDAVLIDNQGMDAALADRVLNINKNARIVTAPRTWRFYLERKWGDDVTPPPDILRPANDEEREQWRKYVTKGWNKGVEQANEIFQADLNKLLADFKGMIRYRELLAQNMISPPFTTQTYRGVTGNDNTMRVGDRALEITNLPKLQTGSEKWQPVNR